jgi:hypothetical protein
VTFVLEARIVLCVRLPRQHESGWKCPGSVDVTFSTLREQEIREGHGPRRAGREPKGQIMRKAKQMQPTAAGTQWSRPLLNRSVLIT